jgi:8-oxo-dGTP pyrophosphatase MutT (NUDIX family)
VKWTVHGRRPVYESQWVSVWLDDVEIPDEKRFEHHVVRFPRHTVIAVIFDDTRDQVLMLWRHRFIADDWGWELPAGWIDDNESPANAARREAEEETGWRPNEMTKLATWYPFVGISDLTCTAYQAVGATPAGTPDASESARVDWVPVRDVRRLIEDGKIHDGDTLTSLSLALAFSG